MTLDEIRNAILRECNIIMADCDNPTSFPGCDKLTVESSERLLALVFALAAIRKQFVVEV